MVIPEGIVSTGFPATEATCRELGIRFDDWQRDMNRLILAKDDTGDYAADTVVISICRQAGKTFDVGALVFADSIINPGTTTVWTAHRFKVSRETFNELRALAQSPLLLPHIDPDEITSAAGNECIPFRNGSRILFAARERGAIRGFTKVRRLVLDEAQILTEGALSDMAPTMNQAVNPQIILMGTPPKPGDPSDVFTNLRSEALDGTAEGVLFVEFSADPDCESGDREAWREANPSFPRRTSAKAIERMRKLLTDEDFRREGLGIWDIGLQNAAIDGSRWAALEDVEDRRPSPIALSVELSPDRAWSNIGLAGVRSDGHHHLQIVETLRGTADVVDRVAGIAVERKAPVAVDPASPAGALIPDLKAAKVRVVLVTGREYAQACGRLADGVTNGTVHHQGQPLLAVAVGVARWKPFGEARVFQSADPKTDIAPLKAVTLALQALATAKPRKVGTGRAVVLS